MTFKIQRFTNGHPLFTLKEISNSDEHKGLVGVFKSVFGQCVDEKGNFIDYTLERASTLIPNGVFEYKIYNSPTKGNVVRLTKDPKGNDISARCLEHHIANYAYQLKGCCAHGNIIDLKVPALFDSGKAMNNFFLLAGEEGTITYEDLK